MVGSSVAGSYVVYRAYHVCSLAHRLPESKTWTFDITEIGDHGPVPLRSLQSVHQYQAAPRRSIFSSLTGKLSAPVAQYPCHEASHAGSPSQPKT